MFGWAFTFLGMALIAGVVGFAATGVVGAVGKGLFLVSLLFLVLISVSRAVGGEARERTPWD